ncbi:sensor histidine kinase [Bacillus sp. C1]
MNKLTLRMRLTVLTGCILIVTTTLLTVLSIYSAQYKLVIPLSKTIIISDQRQSFNKEMIEGPVLNEGVNSKLALQSSAMDAVREGKEQFKNQSIIWMLTIIVVGIVTIYIVAGKALKPVKELNNKVEKVSEDNLSQRIEKISTKDEIGDLAVSFNKMLDRLEKSFMYQKSFAANAAHELKTPLTIMKSSIQVLKLDKSPTLGDYKENIEVTEQSTERLIQVVNDLLTLADEQTDNFSDPIELKQLFETISVELRPFCMEKDTNISLDICDASMIGSKTLLYRAFSNLIENAIKYNHNGGTVKVIVSVHNEIIRISISDTGIGIPQEEIPFIFEPFYRVEKSRTRQLGGSGLGLSIVRTIIEKHKGTVQVESTMNVGTTFEVNVPVVSKCEGNRK